MTSSQGRLNLAEIIEADELDASYRQFVPVAGVLAQRAVQRLEEAPSASVIEAGHLVSELYETFRKGGTQQVDRARFFGFAARVIRHAHVYFARRNLSRFERQSAELEQILDVAGLNILALEDALQELAKADPECSCIAELRLFVGLKIEEVASLLDRSRLSVSRDWRVAKLYLVDRILKAEAEGRAGHLLKKPDDQLDVAQIVESIGESLSRIEGCLERIDGIVASRSKTIEAKIEELRQ